MKQTETKEIKIITKKLDDACFIDFGTRVVNKKDGGSIYPVYGGGGATFKMDSYNRENCLVVSRFAMSKQCTRFVEGKFYLNDSGLTVRPKNEKELAQEYLDYLLLTLNDTIYSLSRGTAQRNLNVPKFRKLEIKYPDSTDLQLHITNLLSKAENLIAQRKESIRLLDEFLKSTFLEMFGDPVRNEKGWKTRTIEQLVKKEKYALKRGPFGGALKKEIFVPSGYLVYEQFHALNNDFSFARYFIDEAKFQELKGFEVKPGDIIVSCSGVYLGKLAIVPIGAKQGIINQALLKISLDNRVIENVFFVYVFSNENFKRKFYGNVIGTGIPNFPSMDDFKKFNFIYPPIELQTQFAHIVSKTEALKTQYQQSLQELENLYGSLSQKAFRGELGISKNQKGVQI